MLTHVPRLGFVSQVGDDCDAVELEEVEVEVEEEPDAVAQTTRPPLESCSDAVLRADLRRFWRLRGAAKTLALPSSWCCADFRVFAAAGYGTQPELVKLNGIPVDFCTLYRRCCAVGGVRGPARPAWGAIFASLCNSRAGQAPPATAAAELKSYYNAYLASYEKDHAQDAPPPQCALCGSSTPPEEAQSFAADGTPKDWSSVWRTCASCSSLLVRLRTAENATLVAQELTCTSSLSAQHKACALCRGTRAGGKSYCMACLPSSLGPSADLAGEEDCDHGGAGGSGTARETAADHAPYTSQTGDGARVQFMPPRVASQRIFDLCKHRCSPPMDNFKRFGSLIDSARQVLLEGRLTNELVLQSLGLARDGDDPARRTVALLLAGDTTLAAAVYCTPERANCAQLLVAATAREHRRQGHMRVLVEAIITRLAEDGVSDICAGTADGAEDAYRFYTALGFDARTAWPYGMPCKTSSNITAVWVRAAGTVPPGQLARRSGRAARRPQAAAPNIVHEQVGHDGPPDEWPGDVPFVSSAVTEDFPRSDWPQRRAESVIVRRIENEDHPCCGRYGAFARHDLSADTVLMAYAGKLRARKASKSLYIASINETELDVDAETCGNESRYLNHFEGIALQPNVALRTQEHLCGMRWVAVVLLTAVRAGEELLIDYGKSYPRHLLRARKPKRKRRRREKSRHEATAAVAAEDEGFGQDVYDPADWGVEHYDYAPDAALDEAQPAPSSGGASADGDDAGALLDDAPAAAQRNQPPSPPPLTHDPDVIVISDDDE